MGQSRVSVGMVFLVFSNLSLAFTGYLCHLLVGRFFGPLDYGVYVVVINLLMILQYFLHSGVPVALSKLVSEKKFVNDSLKSSGIITQSGIVFAVFSLYFLSADIIASFLNDPGLVKYIRISSIFIPFYGFYCLFDGYLNGLRHY